MKKILLSMLVSLLCIGGLTILDSIAQQQPPPNIKVSLAFSGSRLTDRLLYLMGDRIPISLTLHNLGGQEITSKGFMGNPFHLFLLFTDPDGKGIISTQLLNADSSDDPSPPPVIMVNDQLLQVAPVETVLPDWVSSTKLPDVHAYYGLLKPGNYSVKAIIPVRTYLGIDYTNPEGNFSKIDLHKWQGPLESNTERFTLLADADKDGYYVPEGWPSGALADCNDGDPNEKPGQTWYKDADNDGYSDGITDATSCMRPQGYKLASELIALSGDCDDNDANRNSGKTEISCNGIDDDCNPATPDVPAPTLASPANGAANVSTIPTLSWNAANCATNYGLQVAKDSSFSSGSIVVDESGINSTSYTSANALSGNTTYYWHVNAKKSGETSPWSTTWSFTTATSKTHLLVVTKLGSGNVTVSPGTLNWNYGIGTASYDADTIVTLTATANTNSTFDDWYAFCLGTGGCSVTINGSQCTLNMCGPCFALATFVLKTNTITATAGTGGSISPSGAVKVKYGADQTFTIKPKTGYQIADVKVDDVSQGAISTYTFRNVTANHTISATFKRK